MGVCRSKTLAAGLVVTIMAAAAIGAITIWCNQLSRAEAEDTSPSAMPQRDEKRIPVVLTSARQMTFESRVVISAVSTPSGTHWCPRGFPARWTPSMSMKGIAWQRARRSSSRRIRSS